MDPKSVLQILNLALASLQTITQVQTALQAVADNLSAMQAAGRDPTQEEMDALNAQISTTLNDIHARAAAAVQAPTA